MREWQSCSWKIEVSGAVRLTQPHYIDQGSANCSQALGISCIFCCSCVQGLFLPASACTCLASSLAEKAVPPRRHASTSTGSCTSMRCTSSRQRPYETQPRQADPPRRMLLMPSLKGWAKYPSPTFGDPGPSWTSWTSSLQSRARYAFLPCILGQHAPQDIMHQASSLAPSLLLASGLH